MRRVHSAPARSGMTLIELLVVMMIIATLASLVLSAVFTGPRCADEELHRIAGAKAR